MTLREFCKKYRAGEFKSPDRAVQINAGWYDCFCPEEELPIRLLKIWEILSGITNPYILDNYYVWFKNNCPAVGPLYDDVRFEPVDQSKRDERYFVISIDEANEPDAFTVYAAKHDYEKCYGSDSVWDIHKFINDWGKELQKQDRTAEGIRRRCYEAYKVYWMLTHDVTMSDVYEQAETWYAEEPDGTFEEFVEEKGFNGSLWACYDEFMQAEYLNRILMTNILGMTHLDSHIGEYLNDVRPLLSHGKEDSNDGNA